MSEWSVVLLPRESERRAWSCVGVRLETGIPNSALGCPRVSPMREGAIKVREGLCCV